MAHVTIPNVPSSVTYTVGSTPTTGPFTVPFAFFATSDLSVYKGTTLLALNTDYTVSPTAGTTGGYSGGTITLVATAASTTITISRDVAITRTTDFPTAGPFNITSLNTQLDSIFAILQRINDKYALTIKAPDSEIGTASFSLPAKASRLNTTMGFDANGNPYLAAVDPTTLPTIATSASTSATAAAASATAAASSATAAAGSATAAAASVLANFTATSATSLTIGTGAKSLTINTGKGFAAGVQVRISDAAAPATNYMNGTVTSYNSGSGALVVTVTDIGGSGTLSSWNVDITGQTGATGATGATGPMGPTGPAGSLGSGGQFGGAVDELKSASSPVASAGTTNIWVTDGNYLHISGTTTITSLGTASQAGAQRVVVFDGALILTHNATSLILPGGASITTAAGDVMIVRAETTTNHRVVAYVKADGTPIALAANSVGTSQLVNSNVTTAKIADANVTGAKFATDVVSAQTTVTAVSSDYVLLGDASDSNNVKKALISDITAMVTSTPDFILLNQGLI